MLWRRMVLLAPPLERRLDDPARERVLVLHEAHERALCVPHLQVDLLEAGIVAREIDERFVVELVRLLLERVLLRVVAPGGGAGVMVATRAGRAGVHGLGAAARLLLVAPARSRPLLRAPSRACG